MAMNKVYVAVGNNFQEGLESLDWALKNWSSQLISIVILHFNSNSVEFVYSPLGKLPANSVTDEKLQIQRMFEQKKLLSKYRDFCGKVNVEILKIEKSGEPIHKVMVEMISNLQITKLVMGLTFMKSMSWKSKSSIGGSFYIHQNKPDFCDLFIICGGKLIVLEEENNGKGCQTDEGFFENDRRRSSFKGWLGKVFTADNNQVHHVAVAVAPRTEECTSLQGESSDWWKNHVQEIEDYFQKLSMDPDVNADAAEILRAKMEEAQKTIKEKKEEVKESLARRAKAEWITSLCDQRTAELEKCIDKEKADQNELERNIETSKQELHEVSNEIKESKEKLKSILEHQSELAKKLEDSSAKKSLCEAKLMQAMTQKIDIVKDIEKFGCQRDVFRRMVGFCREKETSLVPGTVLMKLNSFREFSVDELREATDDFSERLRLKTSSGAGTSVYRGVLNHTTVAIKFPSSLSSISKEDFKFKMELLQQIRHPYLIAMIGACSELKCIIYEYMHNRSLHEVLSHFIRKRVLSWSIRIQIAAQICSALGFLHLAKPKPIHHGNLNSSKILLDQNLVAKITDFKPDHSNSGSEVKSDVYEFGILMMQLLTGRERDDGLVEEVRRAVEFGGLNDVARDWPLDLAEDFAQIAFRCVQVKDDESRKFTMTEVRKEIEEMKKKAEELGKREGDEVERADGESVHS